MAYVLKVFLNVLQIDIVEEVGDVIGCISEFISQINSNLPKNRLIRYIIYGTGVLVLFQSSPYILRNTPIFDYHYNHMAYFHRCCPQILDKKIELLSDLKYEKDELPKLNNEKLVILEINAGGGSNLTYYPDHAVVIATDINASYGEKFSQNQPLMDRIIFDRFLHTCPEELYNIPDNSVSAVVCVHSLCQARSLQRALSEILRVLLPGGRLYFIEHVQEFHKFSYRWFNQMKFFVSFALVSCHVSRSTHMFLENAGFKEVNYQTFRANLNGLISPLQALAPHIYGVCVK